MATVAHGAVIKNKEDHSNAVVACFIPFLLAKISVWLGQTNGTASFEFRTPTATARIISSRKTRDCAVAH